MHPSNTEYIYDGSLHGFYCCVFESIYRYEIPCAITPQANSQPSLFKQYYVETDAQKAKRVRYSILKHISKTAQTLIEDTFLSNAKNRELSILDFIVFGYQIGPIITDMLGHEKVSPLIKAQQHLLSEAHIFTGFVRFVAYKDILVATIKPKNFILPYIAPHFIDRYKEENFLIFDKTNQVALVYQNNQSNLIEIDKIDFLEIDEEEQNYQNLWKLFFNTTAIPERINLKRQLGHMPKRYWENLTEM